MQIIKDIPGIKCSEPPGAFYIFPEVDSFFGKKTPGGEVISNADDLCMFFLNKAHVSIVTGKAFGEPGCVRISFANSMEKIEIAMARIKEALGKLSC